MNNDNGWEHSAFTFLHFAHQWYWHNPFSFWLIDSKVISTIWVWLIGRPVSKGLNRSKGCTFYILHFTRLTDLTDVQMFRFDILYILYISHSWHLTFDIVDIWHCWHLTLLTFDIWHCWHLILLTFDIIDNWHCWYLTFWQMSHKMYLFVKDL